GSATIETYTVMHDRNEPSFAILFGRLPDGRRFIANTPEDGDLLRSMTEVDYVGRTGTVLASDDGRNIFVPV
ncbi:MAG: acetyl-CoA acetyltransferase, partial [Hyphomicrobiaceae bacterium]